MTSATPPLASAICDGTDLLLSADEPLASLQLRCGGTIPGAIAVPALAALVAKARQFRLKLARPLLAQDGQNTIRAWVEIAPRADGQPGCAIALRHWQSLPLSAEDTEAGQARRSEITRALAELTARLDARQCLLAVDSDAADLAPLAAAMRAGLGGPWTDFVEVAGSSHRQPMHWRLLDGAGVTIAGSPRGWHASLIAQGPAGGEPSGFELCLTADVPASLPAVSPSPAAEAPAAGADSRLVGRELAPALRQPIARIIANAETIRTRMAGPLDPQYARYAEDIATAGAHLLSLVDDLADLEVIEQPQFTTARDPIDLADVARRACGILSARARERGITLAAPPEGSSRPATAEFRRVLQILLNLIGNAIRYAPQNSHVAVTVEPADTMARIIVADQGPGLGAAQTARIFDKYERLGRSGDGGSGLGLYISRRLARTMGGDLTVASAPGAGARFILDVPAA